MAYNGDLTADISKDAAQTPQPCRTCGTCPTCGTRPATVSPAPWLPTYPWYQLPYQPQPYIYPQVTWGRTSATDTVIYHTNGAAVGLKTQSLLQNEVNLS